MGTQGVEFEELTLCLRISHHKDVHVVSWDELLPAFLADVCFSSVLGPCFFCT